MSKLDKRNIMEECTFNFINTYSNLNEVFYTHLKPEPVTKPELVLFNEGLASSIGLDFSSLTKQKKAALFSGNYLPTGAEPLSQAYAGHQFGHFTILGDGRAHLLGEHVTENAQKFDIQLKGSGRTPYSRSGDGRAVLGPMLREYIISEGMYALGVSTTRSLAVVSSGDKVIRETPLPGAILTRVATSHIRVGTFQYVAMRQDRNLLKSLLDYTVNRHAPELNEAENKALALLDRIIELQADLIVNWMRVGFIHGVMNTDNMALSGETIDYGPCAFLDEYNPNTVFSSIDKMGRYAYANQPKIARWNIVRLAEALLPLIDHNLDKSVELAEETLKNYTDLYKSKSLNMMRSKLGLFGSEKEDQQLANDLLDWMYRNQRDYTNTFRDLSGHENLTEEFYDNKEFLSWKERWRLRQKKNKKPARFSQDLMKQTNPAVIPRNHNVERALEAAHEENFQPLKRLLEVIKKPYQDDPNFSAYHSPPDPSERVYQTFCGT